MRYPFLDGVLTMGGGGASVPGRAVSFGDAAITSGMAALVSELEKCDPVLKQPLTSITYPRDIPIVTGGGWVDKVSGTNIQYGVSGGSSDSLIASAGSESSKVIQVNTSKETWGVHTFSITMRVGYIDQQRGSITGRSIEQMYTDGIRMAYDKHMDQNTYIGMPSLSTHGIMNDPNVTTRMVTVGTGGSTQWSGKSEDEILDDFNTALITNWNQAENDPDALPNHVLLPYEQLNMLIARKVSNDASKSILTYLQENNIVQANGGDLFIGATGFNKGAGVGKSDRMVVYANKERFLKMEELVSLSRIMTQSNADKASYDSLYVAHVSEVVMNYYESVGYYDGI